MSAPASDSGPQQATPPEPEDTGPDIQRPEVHALLEKYWRTNVTITIVLLVVWAIVGLGFGILAADWFNQYKLPGTGFPLGFWLAQQGSIVAFVLLILIYCILMNRLDAKHHRELARLNGKGRSDR